VLRGLRRAVSAYGDARFVQRDTKMSTAHIASRHREQRMLRRTGSASRRAAARSGLYWNPGLPRSGALATVPHMCAAKTSGE
jgi:hypothetical protein